MTTPRARLLTWTKDALTANLALKTLSLVCSLLIFFFIHGADQISRPLSVGVIAVLPPSSDAKQLMSPLPTEVDVRVSGSRTLVTALRAEEIPKVVLHLEEAPETRLTFLPEQFSFPPGIRVDQVYQPPIDLRWDDVIEKDVDVRWNKSGEPGQGLMVHGVPRIEPPTVRLVGPESILETISYVETAVTPLRELPLGALREPVPLVSIPAGVKPNVNQVIVHLEIGPKLLTKVFPRLRIEVAGHPRATAVPRFVNAHLTGTQEQLAQITEDHVVARVDLASHGFDLKVPGNAVLPIGVDMPGVSVALQPPTALVKW